MLSHPVSCGMQQELCSKDQREWTKYSPYFPGSGQEINFVIDIKCHKVPEHWTHWCSMPVIKICGIFLGVSFLEMWLPAVTCTFWQMARRLGCMASQHSHAGPPAAAFLQLGIETIILISGSQTTFRQSSSFLAPKQLSCQSICISCVHPRKGRINKLEIIRCSEHDVTSIYDKRKELGHFSVPKHDLCWFKAADQDLKALFSFCNDCYILLA